MGAVGIEYYARYIHRFAGPSGLPRMSQIQCPNHRRSCGPQIGRRVIPVLPRGTLKGVHVQNRVAVSHPVLSCEGVISPSPPTASTEQNLLKIGLYPRRDPLLLPRLRLFCQ